MNLPDGWIAVHKKEGLEVRKEGDRWILLHLGNDTGHRFLSAEDAIEHAEDARIHGS